MLIDLFSDPNLLTKMSRPLGYMVTNRKCEIVRDLSFYETAASDDLDKQFHIESVRNNKDREREYTNISVGLVDSHNEIEKLGVCKHQRPYTVIVSMEDSLDYILHRITGAKIENIRNMPGYKQISRALLKLNYSALGDTNFGLIKAADPLIAEYFEQQYLKVESEDVEKKVEEVSSEFVLATLKELRVVLEYISCHYFSVMKNSPLFSDPNTDLVLRSRSLCSFVMTSDFKLEDELVIRSEGKEDYRVFVRSFERNEYFDKLDLAYA